jgi:hypothetical protein
MGEIIFTFWPLHRFANNTVGPMGLKQVWRRWRRDKSLPTMESRTSPVSQTTGQHYTEGATPYTIYNSIHYISQYVLNMIFFFFFVTLPVRRLYCVIGRWMDMQHWQNTHVCYSSKILKSYECWIKYCS